LRFPSQKIGAIILVLMMAPKLSGGALLGGHHLYVTPRTRTGVIRTTARDTILREEDGESDRTFEMAQRNILNRHQDNSMWAARSISQINSFVPRNKQELCKDSRRTAH
jgi:hypothetical protein